MLVNRSSSDENKTINDFSFSRDKRIHARCYIGNIIIFIIRERLKKKKNLSSFREILFFFLRGRVKYFLSHNATFIYRFIPPFISQLWLLAQGVNVNYNKPRGYISRLKISLVFALNYLETVNFIISSLRETFVLARVGNRKLFLQYCGRCTYYLRRSWNRAKMPLNGHLRKPKTLLSPTVSLSCFTR